MKTPSAVVGCFIAILFALVFLLAACSPISSGEITAKGHSDAYYYTTMQCASFGKYGCTSWIPIMHYMPEQFSFSLVLGDEEGYVYVTESTWNEYEVGDFYEEER
jgi:uncharacterized protein YceK